MLTMTYETWLKQFEPMKNRITNNTAIEGNVYLPHGKDLEFIRRQPRDHIWTFFVSDEPRRSAWLIGDGFHVVNAMGYLVTKRPYEPDKTYLVRY